MDYRQSQSSKQRDTPSLSVRLMQIAGEYEMERKAEKAILESDLAKVTEEKLALERQLLEYEAKEAENSKQIGRYKQEVEGSRRRIMFARIDVSDCARQLFQIRKRFETTVVENNKMLRDVLLSLSSLQDTLQNATSESKSATINGSISTLKTNIEKITTVIESSQNSRPTQEETSFSTNILSMSQKWLTDNLYALAESGNVAGVERYLSVDREDDLYSSEESRYSMQRILNTSLEHALRGGHIPVVRFLLSSGASATHRSEKDGLLHTPLHTASMRGHDRLLRMLLSKDSAGNVESIYQGHLIDERDCYGRTALYLASQYDHGKIVSILLAHGADPTITDINGLTALQACSQGGSSFPVLPWEPPAPVGPALSALDELKDAQAIFWNSSYRANKAYGEKQFQRAIDAYTAAIEVSSLQPKQPHAKDLATLFYNRGRSYYRLGHHVAAIEDCMTALRSDPNYRNALAQRGECLMSLFDFGRAELDFKSLIDSDPHDTQWVRRRNEASIKRQLSHYAVLGVRRDASASDIKKSYRTLCLKWHPDKHVQTDRKGGKENLYRSNMIFQRLSVAYETLIDPDSRRAYDRDPSSFDNTITDLGASLLAELERDAERELQLNEMEAFFKAQKEREEETMKVARNIRHNILMSTQPQAPHARPSAAPAPPRGRTSQRNLKPSSSTSAENSSSSSHSQAHSQSRNSADSAAAKPSSSKNAPSSTKKSEISTQERSVEEFVDNLSSEDDTEFIREFASSANPKSSAVDSFSSNPPSRSNSTPYAPLHGNINSHSKSGNGNAPNVDLNFQNSTSYSVNVTADDADSLNSVTEDLNEADESVFPNKFYSVITPKSSTNLHSNQSHSQFNHNSSTNSMNTSYVSSASKTKEAAEAAKARFRAEAESLRTEADSSTPGRQHISASGNAREPDGAEEAKVSQESASSFSSSFQNLNIRGVLNETARRGSQSTLSGNHHFGSAFDEDVGSFSAAEHPRTSAAKESFRVASEGLNRSDMDFIGSTNFASRSSSFRMSKENIDIHANNLNKTGSDPSLTRGIRSHAAMPHTSSVNPTSSSSGKNKSKSLEEIEHAINALKADAMATAANMANNM